MKLSDFDYVIPQDQIAQHPLRERDSSRLLVINRKGGTAESRIFRDITAYLRPGDVLVLNDTRVVPVRIPCARPSGGSAEITLLRELSRNCWEALVKGVHDGVLVLDRSITARVERMNGTVARVEFDVPHGNGHDIRDVLHDIGVMPLPLYIKRKAAKSDEHQYQTVYAAKDGAVAAPTAGLHFTEELIASIRSNGTDVQTITLHVGYGTFKPVTAGDIGDHRMDEESFEISPSTADAVNSAREEGRRVIAVGTTVTRALESSAGPSGAIRPGAGKTALFIYPGHAFRVVGSLVTNFHLPRSTPLMLAGAFAGLDLLKKSYVMAQSEGYRFYSYGDAMMIL
ncbi:MAG: tRNA preQ1(34) S-adenosylmethionine ribosyltransferase-isomerase QueA [Nitrospiraceae bacterium]|nr:MAG: tRNA preQ1(34) S-adenosylmethionine ribosyltransferase-isomerase QueA [Nitrospiraceae bacterium]